MGGLSSGMGGFGSGVFVIGTDSPVKIIKNLIKAT